MAKRVWVISELYYPEETSTGYILTKIAEGLARYFPVNVLCSQPTYSSRGVRAPSREQHNGVSIQRCPGTVLNKDVLMFRLINLVAISASIFVSAMLRISKGDVVLVVTNPPLLPFGVNLACWLRKAKCLLLIHDVYPEVLIAAGMVGESSILARVIGWFNRRLYQRVIRIIVLGRDMADLSANKLQGGNPSKIAIIPNWADLDLVSPRSRKENIMLTDLGLSNRFIVQYAGNMGRTHGIESLWQAAQKLNHMQDVHFLFIGSGAKIKWLEESIQSSGLSNMTVIGNRQRAEQPVFLNACDVSIISYVPGMAGISVPSRLYNVMAAGKPIIAVVEEDSELALVVKEERIGWVVPPGDVDGIVAAILEAHANPDCLAEMGQRACLVAETKYSFERVIESYHRLIKGLGDSLGA
jgi:glycosyltransferase involved in cell wall biosynthesis